MRIILAEEDHFFMSVSARLYYGRFIRQTPDGALCHVLNGNFRVLVNAEGRGTMPNTKEPFVIEMIRRPRALPFHRLNYQAALTWYVAGHRKLEVTV